MDRVAKPDVLFDRDAEWSELDSFAANPTLVPAGDLLIVGLLLLLDDVDRGSGLCDGAPMARCQAGDSTRRPSPVAAAASLAS